ncbi:MAG: hypothetical protein HYU99_04720 [Deltaproteobacteria bacterium]|nr:hypothetical protein [Deltaproteobacteria bacterium]
MSREISQEPSYQFLVDPTPDNPFSKSDYLDAANNDSVYLRNDYPFEWVEDDLTALFPDKLPKDWAEKYFHWWMEQRRMEVIDVDPSFYEAVNREQWNGDWALRSPYRVNAVRVTLGKTTAWLKKREFEEIVRVEGFYPLGGLAVNSWDEILEIAATAPALLDKISLGPPHSITQEKIDLYLKQMERELSRVADPPEGFLRSASLPQGEMQLKVRTQRAERVKLSAGGGWVALDYEAGATVQGYFNLQAGRAAVPDGTYLFSFKGVSISLRPEQIVDLIQKRDGAGFSPLLSKISSVVKAVVGDTKDYYRLPAVGIIVSGGRPQLEIDLASHPLIRKTLNLPPDKDSHILLHIDLSLAGDFGAPGFAGDWVGDPSVRFQSDLNSDLLLKMAEEIMQSVQQSGGGGGLFASILPSSYSGEIKLRSVNGGYVLDLPHPLLGEEAKVAGGALKLDFDSRGITSAEGRLPVYFLRNAGDEEGRTASATVDFRVADDETGRYRGWLEVHSDELPAFIGGASGSAEANVFFSDLELNRGATGLNDLIGRMVNEFEVRMTQNGSESVLVQGGGIYTHEDTQVYLSGDGNVLSLPGVSVDRNPVAVSWNGVPGVPGKNFELSGFSFELMEGVRFEIEDVVGSYAKNSDETIANVKGVFQFTADGPFVAERRVIYEGEIVWNPKQQTFTIADLDIPLPDLALAFRQGDEKFPFVFSGELTGTIQADLRRSSVTGPFALSGDLFYDADIRESGMLILPQWLRVKGPFLAGASYRGVVYRPGERHQLKEAGEVVQNSGNTNRVRSIKGVEFQVNSLRRDKGGAVLADLQINLDGIHLLSEEMIPPYSAKVEFEAETADGKNGEDSPSGLVVRSRPFGLNDEDTHLDRYGLDNEKAEMMRDIIHNSEEANFSLTGFKIKNTGSPFFYVPHNAVPRIDVRVRNGLIDRFHLYFSQPVGIPPVIRGVYFDKWAGKFRLDWLNHGDGERRIVNGNEPEITKMLFGLIPLPEEEIDRLASRAALDPDFVTDDASVWLEFFISTLVALDRDAFRRREKPKEGYPV